MGSLFQFVYVSTAAGPLTREEIDHLLERARTRNSEQGVTGVLLYAGGKFMQCLEGERLGIRHVYEFIKADPHHYGITELSWHPVAQREFGQWSMAFSTPAAAGGFPELEDEARVAHLGPSHSQSLARLLLHRFWNGGAGPHFRM